MFYSDRMVAASGSYSPSAEKPAAVVASWRNLAIALRFFEPVAATLEVLSAAHDPEFVRTVLSCATPNGFGNHSAAVAASLPFTVGAMVDAARHARTYGGAAVAPCAGFHHARYADVGGFCTFNGLMVAACALRLEGAARVGILDFDHHYGDGTQDIIERLGAANWCPHYSAGRHFHRPGQAALFLDSLPALVSTFEACDVVLYQAGADPHVDDPLGGWLTTAQLRHRDSLVFRGLNQMNVPVAWNLAGGYQRDAADGIAPVLHIHDNTLRACAEVYLSR